MKLLYLLFTHNRKTVLNECWHSLFAKNKLRPDRLVVIDDASTQDVKAGLFNSQFNGQVPIDFFSIGKNIGYGKAAELGLKIAEAYNPEYLYFLESDYVFAENGLDIVDDLFQNNEFAKESVGFSGYDNPDFYDKSKTEEMFPRIIKEDCGEDNLNRGILFKPFEQDTTFGKVKLEFVSNSCGTMYLNWKKIQQFKAEFPILYQIWLDKVTDKGKEKRLLNDGMMSHGISWIWQKYAQKHGIDRNKYAALLNIKPSVANHINGGGINGYIVPEGATFVSSPSFAPYANK